MEIKEKDILSSRGDLALELLKLGESPLQIENISITNFRGEGYTLYVWSAWGFDNITKSVAQNELERGFQLFSKIIERWKKLSDLIDSNFIPTYLCDNYGMGSIQICERFSNGTVKWELETKT
ncbi:MAG: hypothetical protein QM500_20920 [Methylococcales bacterium]